MGIQWLKPTITHFEVKLKSKTELRGNQGRPERLAADVHSLQFLEVHFIGDLGLN